MHTLKFLLMVTSLAPLSRSQYSIDRQMRPDVTFDTHNDRFDITSIIQDQNRYNNFANYRRSEDKPLENQMLNSMTKNVPSMKDFVFAEADNDSAEGGTVADFENSLQQFKSRKSLRQIVERLHGQANVARRANSAAPDPEQEILLSHAVPVRLNIHGYLQTPLVE